MKKQGRRFDFFFIDADKENYQNYLDSCIDIANQGAVITVDNVLWKGEVMYSNRSEKAKVIHQFNEDCAHHSRLNR